MTSELLPRVRFVFARTKMLLAATCMLAAALNVTGAENGKFTATVSAEDLAAAGLSTLTPAQRARLDALVEDYKSGALAAARRAADEALAAKQAAEAKAARAEANAATARADAAKVTPSGGLVGKAKGLLKPGAAKEVATIESSIVGQFRGWEPRQIFTLANGQRWQVANNESYYTPVRENPKVELTPAAFAGYWMRFPQLGTQVRVMLVGE